MNTAFLLLSSAALAGADPTPPPPPPPTAPPLVVSGSGCTNCGTPAYSSGCCGSSKPGLLDRLKGRFAKSSADCGCAPAPVHVAPAPCSSCGTHLTSVAERPNLFDSLKSRWGSKSCCGHAPACGPACDSCGASHLIAAPPAGGYTPPPATMPAPGTPPPQSMPKPPPGGVGGNTSSSPQPLPPVTGAGLTGNSPY